MSNMLYRVIFPFTDRAAALEFLHEQRAHGMMGLILDQYGNEIHVFTQPIVAGEDGFSVKVNPFRVVKDD